MTQAPCKLVDGLTKGFIGIACKLVLTVLEGGIENCAGCSDMFVVVVDWMDFTSYSSSSLKIMRSSKSGSSWPIATQPEGSPTISRAPPSTLAGISDLDVVVVVLEVVTI